MRTDDEEIIWTKEVTEFLKSLAGHSFFISDVLHCPFCSQHELGVNFCEYIREKIENN